MTDDERTDPAGESIEDRLRAYLADAGRRPTADELWARVEARTGGRLSLDEATAILRQERERR
jgi:hypothetical protein